MRRLGPRGTVAAWVLSMLIAAIAGAWATRVTFVPPSVAEATPEPQLYTVVDGSVGQRGNYTASLAWPTSPVAAGAASGTVTAVHVRSGDTVQEGEALFDVDLRPVVVVQGAIPMFRDLAVGAEGEDVRQLQDYLYREHWLSAAPNGKFGDSTRRAVERWQAKQRVPKTGAVLKGDIVFAAQVPLRVALHEDLKVGAVVAPGDELVLQVAASPKLTIDVSSSQRGTTLETGMRVAVTVGEVKIDAVLGEFAAGTSTDGQTASVELVAADGSPVCASGCDGVPYTIEPAKYPAEIILEEEVAGPSVPPSALGVAADGQAYVVVPGGARMPVTVQATSASRVVVDGISVGTQVLLFATDPPMGPAGGEIGTETSS